MSDYKLLKINPDDIAHLKSDDECYYYADYHSAFNIPNASQHSPTQLIRNFKKSMNRKGQSDWKYKYIAIDEVAKLLKPLYENINDNYEAVMYCHIPTSKTLESSEYDNRFEIVHEKLKKQIPNLQFLQPLHIKEMKTPLHAGGVRNVQDIKDNYEWDEKFPTHIAMLIVLDDVITTGSTFRAFKDTVLENIQDCRVIGIFITKTK